MYFSTEPHEHDINRRKKEVHEYAKFIVYRSVHLFSIYTSQFVLNLNFNADYFKKQFQKLC